MVPLALQWEVSEHAAVATLWSSCQLLISSRAGLSVLKEKTAARYICKEDLLDSLVLVTAAAAQEHRQAKCGAPQLLGKPALGERLQTSGPGFLHDCTA